MLENWLSVCRILGWEKWEFVISCYLWNSSMQGFHFIHLVSKSRRQSYSPGFVYNVPMFHNLCLDAKSETWSKFDLLGQYGARTVFDQYMEKSTLENGKLCFKCTLCGKENTHLNNLRNHIESAHFPGHFSYNCNHCGKTFKNKNSLFSHVSLMHRGQNLWYIFVTQ